MIIIHIWLIERGQFSKAAPSSSESEQATQKRHAWPPIPNCETWPVPVTRWSKKNWRFWDCSVMFLYFSHDLHFKPSLTTWNGPMRGRLGWSRPKWCGRPFFRALKWLRWQVCGIRMDLVTHNERMFLSQIWVENGWNTWIWSAAIRGTPSLCAEGAVRTAGAAESAIGFEILKLQPVSTLSSCPWAIQLVNGKLPLFLVAWKTFTIPFLERIVHRDMHGDISCSDSIIVGLQRPSYDSTSTILSCVDKNTVVTCSRTYSGKR